MAIVQISRITHRKGLQQDLPQLASAELGWSIDTRQLYIGNGTISEGAPTEGITEILTQYSDILNIGNQYIFKGSESGYTSQTGLTALTPVTQTLQQRLDEVVSVRDFGALGDGATDDTAAIQRAIDQILFGGFALTQPKLRRQIFFPPGNYLISSSIKIPSYLFIRGSGQERTTIRQTSGTGAVFQLKDSSNNVDSLYGQLGAATVRYVTVQDITLQHLSSKNIVTLDSCNEIDFFRVTFRGSQAGANSTSTTGQNAVYAVPTTAAYGDIDGLRFIDCRFTNCTQGLILAATNVKIIGCDFSDMSRSIWVDTALTTATVKNIKISSSTFDLVAKSAIYVTAPSATVITNVTSIGNHFAEVGTGRTGTDPTAAVVYFNSNGNNSIGDTFLRTDAQAFGYPRVYHVSGSRSVSISANTGIQTGMISRGSGLTLTLQPIQTNANTGIVIDGGIVGSTVMEYLMLRPGAATPAVRFGTITAMYNNNSVTYTDEYTENPNADNYVYGNAAPVGVSLNVVSIGSNKYVVQYTSDSYGSGTLTYSITSLQL
jgi:hypothetical protein